jgi:hypothetical protein
MISDRVWILIGLCVGTLAGLIGAFYGSARVRGRLTQRFRRVMAAATLLTAICLGAVALGVTASRGLRALLLLAPGFLGYSFIRQILGMRSAGIPRPGSDSDRCTRCKEG